jgi:16S rRNA processing protein RimM
VILGRITAPYGVKGWVRVRPDSESTASLLRYRSWWVGDGESWRERDVAASRVQGTAVVALLAGCGDRDAAAALRGKHVAVARSVLPETAANEYYWTDLIGLQVVNVPGEELGAVARILETGANDVLVVHGARERLIPFVATVIREVDLAKGVIRVDWGADY